MRRLRGFTLIELITVITIIGILAVVALPRLGGENVFRERGFRDGLATSLSYARRMAVAGRHFVCVDINGQASGSVTLRRDPNTPESVAAISCTGSNGVALNLPTQQSGCAANQLCAPATVTLNGNAATVLYFDALGRLVSPAAPSSVATINPSIAVSGMTAVTVDATTGYVQ